MTLQKIYKKSCVNYPNISTVYDDTRFEYIFEIPESQHIIDVDNNNPVYAINLPNTWTQCPAPATQLLKGQLVLSTTNVSVECDIDSTTVYIAGYDTNSIIFEYSGNSYSPEYIVKAGDVINNKIITKVVNWFGHFCYAEFINNTTETFTKDRVYSVNADSTIIVKAGFGILVRAGILGKFATKFKQMKYYAKFKSLTPTITNTTKFKDFPTTHTPNVPDDSRWYDIQSNILNPALTNHNKVSSIQDVSFISTNSNIEGTSNINDAINLSSFLDIPSSSSQISYGISDYQPLDNRTDLLGPIELPITVNFNRVYTGVPVTHTNTSTSRLIDGWLLHRWSVGYTSALSDTGQSITCSVPDYSEPMITYSKDINYIYKISAFSQTNPRQELILFANNDNIVTSGTHTLNYNIEPYNSSDITEYYDIQSKYVVSCIYKFDVRKLTDINKFGSNLEYPVVAETHLTKQFLYTDTSMFVNSTNGFLSSGYLSIPIYTISIKNTNNNDETRTYNYIGRKIVSYTHKHATKFMGITSINYPNIDILKLTSIEFPDLYPVITQHFIF